MPMLTLPSRQRLSRRVQFFGDSASDYRTSLHSRSDLTQWQKMIMLDPEGQSIANYEASHAAAPDLFPMPIPAEFIQYVKDMGGPVPGVQGPAFQDAPVTAPKPADNTGILNPLNPFYVVEVAPRPVIPPTPDEIARQNALRTNQDPAFQENPPVTISTNAPETTVDNSGKVEVKTEAKKTNSLILPGIAALAAYLLLKG